MIRGMGFLRCWTGRTNNARPLGAGAMRGRRSHRQDAEEGSQATRRRVPHRAGAERRRRVRTRLDDDAEQHRAKAIDEQVEGAGERIGVRRGRSLVAAAGATAVAWFGAAVVGGSIVATRWCSAACVVIAGAVVIARRRIGGRPTRAARRQGGHAQHRSDRPPLTAAESDPEGQEMNGHTLHGPKGIVPAPDAKDRLGISGH